MTRDYVGKVIAAAIEASQDGTHSLVLARDEAEARGMLNSADKLLGRARWCGRQILVNGAALYTITTWSGPWTGGKGMLWIMEAAGADPDALGECLNEVDREIDYVWWPDRRMQFERVLFSDWLREYPNNTWRPVTLKGDLCISPEVPLPPVDARTIWQALMETE
jgi:hypothetical protein